MPVRIDQAHQPLGTHLFSIDETGDPAQKAEWVALTVEGSALGGSGDALNALNRFTIPDAARKRIETMLTPHSSLAISDTGLGTETGKGTDFIVIARDW